MRIEHMDGEDFLVIEEEGGEHVRQIAVAALASWSELLGVDDLDEVLDIITHVQDHGEPEPDPVTGENVWTDAYTLLARREQSRETEVIKAREEGTQDDPRSPELRAAMAAYNAVHQPIDDGECAMDRCRRHARERLGIGGDPRVKCGAGSRLMTHRPSVRGGGPLEGLVGHVELVRRQFLHDLVGTSENPLRDTTPPDVEHTVEELDPFAATMRKYGG